uniref:Uncharacterized protein n=1 Tax=Anguilla anguilla TaxID=7936 RepID=A0A0E9VV99_ANGAN
MRTKVQSPKCRCSGGSGKPGDVPLHQAQVFPKLHTRALAGLCSGADNTDHRGGRGG